MYPTIRENSLLFIDTSNSKFLLSSINQDYEDMEVQEFKIIGKVVGVFSKV